MVVVIVTVFVVCYYEAMKATQLLKVITLHGAGAAGWTSTILRGSSGVPPPSSLCAAGMFLPNVGHCGSHFTQGSAHYWVNHSPITLHYIMAIQRLLKHAHDESASWASLLKNSNNL